MVDGHRCLTFKQAAEKYGLLEHDESIRQCLLEAANFQMPSTLRRMFSSILVYCLPIGVRDIWNKIYIFLSQDYATFSGANSNRVKSLVLQDLNNVLQQHNIRVSDYDIPQHTHIFYDSSTIPKLIQDERCIPVSEDDLNSVANLNTDQHIAFTTIMGATEHNDGAIFFVDGPGGTGKTYLYRALLATIRNSGDIAIATATSGIAATLLLGVQTEHSWFKIPLHLEPTSTCSISKLSDLATLIRETKVVIWDEAPMTNRYAFKALIRTLIDILGVDMPFGGKIIVFGGDFRQVLSVVHKGTRAETIASSIVKSPLRKYVRVLHHKQNMRSTNDHEFGQFLLRVGDGSEPSTDGDFIKIPNSIAIPWEGTQSIDTLIDNIYLDLQNHANDARYMVGRGVITPLNDDVNKINKKVISQFPGTEKKYHSFDRVENDTYNTYQQEFLNSICPGGMPRHVLLLKVGSPIILLRNIGATIGLCNGTRLICRSLNRNFVDAEVLDGPHRGIRAFLHRIPLKPPESMQLPFDMTRVQFKIRLSFALTINKAQGQTIPHLGVYLPDHVFGHGQLYVALSRSISWKTTKILVVKGSTTHTVEVHTKNVVYPEVLLRNIQQSKDDQ